MKTKFLNAVCKTRYLALLVVLIFTCGNAWGTVVTYTFDGDATPTTTGTAPAGSTAALSGSYSNNGGWMQCANSGSAVLTLTGYTGYKITGITIQVKSNKSSGTGSFSVVAGSTTIASIASSAFNTANWNGAWNNSSSGVSKTLTMSNDNYGIKTSENVVLSLNVTSGGKSLYIQSWAITYEAAGGGGTCSTPTFSPAAGTYCGEQSVTISSTTTGSTIYYTTDGTTPTTSSSHGTAGAATASVMVSSSQTLKAIAVKDGMTTSATGSAAYTINTPLTTMDAIYSAATTAGSTPTAKCITFNNWVVSGASSNGRNVYVTDGSKGFIIYGNSDTEFRQGDILSGTVSCNIQLYNQSAELTGLTTSTIGLSVTKGGSVTPVVKNASEIASLTGAYTGIVITTTGEVETCNSSKQCINGAQLYNQLYNYAAVTTGNTYTATGVYLQYGATQEILPLSNLEEVSYTITALSNNNSYGTVSLIGNVITASPVSGYRVSTTTAYEVTAGTATVTDNGNNTFTVTPSSDCTVRINFEAIPTHDIHFDTGGLVAIADATGIQEGATYDITQTPAASLSDDCEYNTFVGWTTASSITDASVKPSIVTSITMSTSDVTLYAVYSKTEGGGGGATLTKMVTGNTLADGDKIVVVANGTTIAMYQETTNTSYVQTWDCSTLNTSTVSADDKNWWTVSATEGGFYLGDETNGYLNMSSNELYCNNTKSIWTLNDLSDETFKLQSGGRNLSYRSDLTAKKWRMGGTSYGTSGQTVLDIYKYSTGGGGTTTYSLDAGCCENKVELSVGSLSHCSAMSIDNTDLATCSNTDADRQVTITVTPDAGYEMTSEARLTFTPTDGDPYPTATYVSGPTPVGATYQFVYEFKKGDNGDGTFTATCTPKAISLVLDKNNSDVSGSADGSATVYFDATSLSTISHATRSGHVLDGYYAEPECTNKVLTDAGALVNSTGYVVSDKWARATTPTTLYAKWIAKSFDDYVFSCAELTLTPHLVTASTPIFITSAANKKVRSQDYIEITGSGLTPNTALTFPNLPPGKFEVLTATGGTILTDEIGAISVNAYIFYTPAADATTDGLDKITGITVSVGGAKPKQVSLTQDIIGRHLPTAGYVIAGKKDNKWYALPSNMSSTTNPKPSEIAVDDLNNPSIAYTAASNIYGLEGPTTSGAGNNISSGNGQYIRLTMSINDGTLDPHAAPLFGNSTGNNDIGKSGNAQASSHLSAGWWWLLTQKNTSITNPKDAKYTIKCANNTSTLNLRDNAGNPDWGLFASGVGELRLIPASDIPYTEAYFVEWGQHGGVVEVDATGIEATSVVARLGEATSSAITLSQTGTSVKGSATKYNYTVNFGEGIDFAAAASNGALLRLEWKNGEAVKAMTSLVVPKIIATSATMSSLIATDDPWNSADVHVLPGVTLTANAGDFSSKDVVVDRLEIYPGATVTVTKGAQDVGTLKVRTLVLRNGWTRVGEKTYDVARLYVYTDANLAKNANDNVWYSDWYIDYDQYYPMAVPFPVATNSITYKNTKSAATAGVKIRYYDGARRAEHEQQDQDDNWVAYTWGDGGTMPENLAPSTGYAMTAKRPSGKAFSIVRMPMTFTNPWTALGEHGYVGETHKDQVSVTGWGKGTAEWYAMGWNFVANPYMCTFNGNDDGISGKITMQEGGDIKYATIPDLDFQNYYQVPIAEANLKPASAFFIQADNAEPRTITFNAGKIVPPSAPARYMTKNEAIPEQEAYIRLSHGEEKDLMGLIIGEDYTAAYEPNADLAKIQGGGNTVKTYMRYSDMDMAYVAINATLAKEWIPVTVNLPADGEYTFSLTNSSTVDALDGVYLIDYKNENTITNLIDNDYVFTAEAGTISDRFAINAIYGERETPTGLDAIEMGTIDPDKPIKFLYHEKVYILYQGIIYDATGKRVREINN